MHDFWARLLEAAIAGGEAKCPEGLRAGERGIGRVDDSPTYVLVVEIIFFSA